MTTRDPSWLSVNLMKASSRPTPLSLIRVDGRIRNRSEGCPVVLQMTMCPRLPRTQSVEAEARGSVSTTRHNDTGPSYRSLEHYVPDPTIWPTVLGRPVGASIRSLDRGRRCIVRLGRCRKPLLFETLSHGGDVVGSSVTQSQSRHYGKYADVPQEEVFQAKSICLVRRSETAVRKRWPVTRRIAKCHGHRWWHQSSSLVTFDKSPVRAWLGCWRSMPTTGRGRCIVVRGSSQHSRSCRT
jgi:hypothetical protein